MLLRPDVSAAHNQPDVHAECMQGVFSVQLGSNNAFGRIHVDQTIEETVNMTHRRQGDQGVQFETRGCEQILIDRRVYGRISENAEGHDMVWYGMVWYIYVFIDSTK